MRKMLLTVACALFLTGLVVAGEATIVKYDKDAKKLTVKEGDAEKTYKITDKTKFSTVGKGGTAKEGTMENLEKMLSNDKSVGRKIDITTSDGAITEIKMTGKKKKDN